MSERRHGLPMVCLAVLAVLSGSLTAQAQPEHRSHRWLDSGGYDPGQIQSRLELLQRLQAFAEMKRGVARPNDLKKLDPELRGLIQRAIEEDRNPTLRSGNRTSNGTRPLPPVPFPGNRTPADPTASSPPGMRTPVEPGNGPPRNGQTGIGNRTGRTPGTRTPDTQTPGTQTPGTQAPGMQTPGNRTGNRRPGTNTPGMSTPGGRTGNRTPGPLVNGEDSGDLLRRLRDLLNGTTPSQPGTQGPGAPNMRAPGTPTDPISVSPGGQPGTQPGARPGTPGTDPNQPPSGRRPGGSGLPNEPGRDPFDPGRSTEPGEPGNPNNARPGGRRTNPLSPGNDPSALNPNDIPFPRNGNGTPRVNQQPSQAQIDSFDLQKWLNRTFKPSSQRSGTSSNRNNKSTTVTRSPNGGPNGSAQTKRNGPDPLKSSNLSFAEKMRLITKRAREEAKKPAPTRNGQKASEGPGMSESVQTALSRAIEKTAKGIAEQAGDMKSGPTRSKSGWRPPRPSNSPFFREMSSTGRRMNRWFRRQSGGGRSSTSGWSAPDVTTPSSSDLRSAFPLILLIGVAGGVIWWLNKTGREDREHRRRLETAVPELPSDVRTRGDLIKAFNALAIRCPRVKGAWWTHGRAAAALARATPSTGSAAVELAELYEQARYAPADEPLSERQLQQAREAFRRCRDS